MNDRDPWDHALSIFILVWLILAGILLCSGKAKAEDDDPHYGFRVVSRLQCSDGWPSYCHRIYYRQRVYRYRSYRAPVYGWRWRRDDYRDERGSCIGYDTQVVSTEHTTEEHARDAARKLWMASVNWRWGARYMDLDLATDIRWRCGPSSAMDNLTGRIAEAAGKLVGRDGQNVRCQLVARPCEAPLERDHDRRR